MAMPHCVTHPFLTLAVKNRENTFFFFSPFGGSALRVSPAVLTAQYGTLQKYILHPSLVIYVFATPHTKLKLGHQIGAGLLIANHLDQSLRRA